MRSKKALCGAVTMWVTPLTVIVCTAFASLASVGVAVAADQPAELVVSATRRDTSVQDVPYSMAAIGGEAIEALQLRDLADITRWTPGIYQIDQGQREANRLVMRGINASDIVASEILRNSQGDRVSTYYGETPVYVNLLPIDLASVEVLRGPQGTLYGSRSLGGTLRYLPNAPQTDEMTIDGHLRGYGIKESSDLGYDVDGVINVPLIEDTLAVRAVLGHWKRPGFIDQPYVLTNPGVSCPEPFFSDPGCTDDDLERKKDTNDSEVSTARLSLLWNVTDDLSVQLSYAFQRNEDGGRQINSRDSMTVITDPGTAGPLDIGPYANGMRYLEINERDNAIANLTLKLGLGNAELLSTTSYNTFEQEGTRDQTDLLLQFGLGTYSAFTTYTADRTDDETFTQEFRLVSNDDDSRWDYIAGAFYQNFNGYSGSNEFEPSGVPNTPDPETWDTDVDRDTEEIALFGELGYQINDIWRVIAGVRAFWVDDEINDCLFGGCDIGGGDDEGVIFKLGADAQVAEDIKVYGLFSQGISLGGSNPDPQVPGFPLPDELKFVKPERTDNYELGLRSTWADNRITFNAAVYYIDWTDIQIDFAYTPDPTNPNAGRFITINADSAHSKGAEADVSAMLNDNWELLAGLALTEGSITDGLDSGARLPGFPKETLNLGTIYNQELSNGMGLTGSYRIAVQSNVKPYLTSSEKLPGFAVHSATLGLTGDRWSATLFIDNIWDKYAVTGVRDDTSAIGTDGGTFDFTIRRYFENVITPRTIGVDLRYRFK